MVIKFLARHAPILRAAIAAVLALAVGAVFLTNERRVIDARERSVFTVTSASWRMSEFVFELQRLASSLEKYQAGSINKTDVNLRFDLVWSRIDVLQKSELFRIGKLAEIIEQARTFLEFEEPHLYDVEVIRQEDTTRQIEGLERFAKDARQAWIEVFFGHENAELAASELVGFYMPNDKPQKAILVLIVLLLGYVLLEVYLTNGARRREEMLREKAAQASATKSRFLANVSHEIRTPLNGIMGMASELVGSDLNDDQKKCVKVIEQSGDVLLSTINDVLDLSRVEAGQLQINREAFELRAVVQNAVDLYGTMAREKQLTLNAEIVNDVPAWVLGDPQRIRQILFNLVANAVKFTARGSIVIAARRTECGDKICFSVMDSGPGISQDAQQKIFDPFGQTDASVTRRHGGTGLGLTIAKQLSGLMGGELSVDSLPGRGSTFSFQLPLPETNAVSQSKLSNPSATAPDLTGLGVLIVDDNATNRLILSRFLKPTSAKIAFACNGEEAFGLVETGEFPIVWMDVQMPIMDGVTATMRIRAYENASRSGKSVILGVTANVFVHQVQSYLAAGMDDVLAKPISKARLFDALSQVRDSRFAA